MNDSEEICSRCNGSGEGQFYGTTCGSCGGAGIERDNEAEYERQCEAADHYNDERKDRACEGYF